ncbi:RNA helicase [Bacillus sp. AFS006103]|nr:RNA helicase [Bacillus sp. AFS006103]
MNANTYPVKHLSIRVPWHDSGWNGSVCQDPTKNTSCLKLRRIAEGKDTTHECTIAGVSIESLSAGQWPPCIAERATFMAPFDFLRQITHPYFKSSKDTHGHLLPTSLRFPAYSAAIVPFRWMLKENKEAVEKIVPIVLDESREPNLSFRTVWWQEKRNQKQLLDHFANFIEEKTSLCFFYAKVVPLVEDQPRILMGVGRVNHVGSITEYESQNPSQLQSVLWERMVQHSIRPDFSDGFLLPYQEIFSYAEQNPDFDIEPFMAFAPTEKIMEYSYASEHVSHDTAIESLLALAGALENIKKKFEGPWDKCLKWIDERLSEMWKLRGPYPGLGSCLNTIGVSLGSFVAKALEQHLTSESEEIWPFVEAMMENPNDYLPNELAKKITMEVRIMWRGLPEGRKNLLKLLSRMEITNDQAKMVYVKSVREDNEIQITDEEITENPYRLYERTRLHPDGIPLSAVDKAMVPNEILISNYPYLEAQMLPSNHDYRRVRAILVYLLERASEEGHTLLPQTALLREIHSMSIPTPCDIYDDLLNALDNQFSDEIDIVPLADGKKAYQLTRLAEFSSLIRKKISDRVSGKRNTINADWESLLTNQLGPIKEGLSQTELELEKRARQEKATILKELADSRISVLIGPAGTGKTTLLATLLDVPAIEEGGVLMLAPTGKARVRMEQVAKNVSVTARTVAQHLLRTKHFDSKTFRYRLLQKPGIKTSETVIVDECSMLTEEMLGALLESIKGVKRLIFVGDPNQLPPIGPGRPFVDIVNYLKPVEVESIFPKVGPGYGQLTIPRRQINTKGVREDLRLAQWFSNVNVSPADDDLFDEENISNDSQHLRFIRWDQEEELPSLLKNVLLDELKLNGLDDFKGFEKSMGGVEGEKGYINFNRKESVEKVENWQILSPVRASQYGVTSINREIHQSFKSQRIKAAEKTFNRYFTKPIGSEKIIYGDKVINTINHSRKYVFPAEGAMNYIANGEIGLVIGEFKQYAKKVYVEFSSQQGYSYQFFPGDFAEEGDPKLELAYALTVHKAQGSEFGIVFVIVPNPCSLLSPELIYTALTRQQQKVIILHQGPREDLLRYSSNQYSENARRYTNLFVAPNMIEVGGGAFLEDRLIHRTTNGNLVRSKSEVIIADLLHASGVEYEYEQPLTLNGITRYPDFTLENDDTGETYYWEHCGMLYDSSYYDRWKKKLEWYKQGGILPLEKGGTLIITEDNENGGIDSSKIKKIIEDLFD